MYVHPYQYFYSNFFIPDCFNNPPQYNQPPRYTTLAQQEIRAWRAQQKIDSAARKNILYGARLGLVNFGGPQSGSDSMNRDEGHIASIWPRRDPSKMGCSDGPPNSSNLSARRITTLYVALKTGNIAEAYMCIAKGKEFVILEGKENNLVLAIQLYPQEKELHKILINNALRKDINNTQETNALIEAAKLLDRGLVERLLKQKADPNLRTPFDQSPLHCAIRFGKTIQHRGLQEIESENMHIKERGPRMFSVVQTLLLHGAAVDPVDTFGKTPLHYLCNQFFDEDVNLQLVSYLIGKGADPKRVSLETPRSLELMAKLDEAISEGNVFNACRLRELYRS